MDDWNKLWNKSLVVLCAGPDQRHVIWEHKPSNLIPPEERAAYCGSREWAPPQTGGPEETMSCLVLHGMVSLYYSDCKGHLTWCNYRPSGRRVMIGRQRYEGTDVKYVYFSVLCILQNSWLSKKNTPKTNNLSKMDHCLEQRISLILSMNSSTKGSNTSVSSLYLFCLLSTRINRMILHLSQTPQHAAIKLPNRIHSWTHAGARELWADVNNKTDSGGLNFRNHSFWHREVMS